ncbi:MAG: DUF465 domain-containing protein [Deltaproteobacteria bacterium]|jgi:uncharacterized protein YdcH (DUF465 family)|nr:DUF465 domain-containing protein [Deltaproteobacteria bacterium]
MEAHDEALIDKLLPHDPELKELVEKHRGFEKRLEELNKLLFLNNDEELEKKTIQKAKLKGKDQIELILARHRA